MVIVSADHYFLIDGVYTFNPTLLPNAHGTCLRDFISACQYGHNVVCDNCNVTPHALSPFVAIAKAYDYDVRIVMCRTVDPAVSFERQLHGVSQVEHNFMRGRLNKMLQEWPGIWPELEVVQT